MTSNPFDNVVGDRRPADDFDELHLRKFEAEMVTSVLKKFKMNSSKFKLLAHQKQATGSGHLTFSAMRKEFPDMPYYFRTALIRNLKKNAQPHNLFNSFSDRKFMAAWDEALEDVPDDFRTRSMVLVLKWPYVKGGVAMHVTGLREKNGMCITYRHKRLLYCLEPLKQFLKHMDWERDE
jgi:hypothetical protein